MQARAAPPALRARDAGAPSHGTRFTLFVCVGAVMLLCVSALSLAIGAVNLSIPDAWDGLVSPSASTNRLIVWEIRTPRLLEAMLVGATLGVGGTLLQGVTRNPLADPTIMGITAAAGLTSAALIAHDPQVDHWQIAMACVAGGLLGAGAIYMVSWQGIVSPVRLALAGVALSAFFGAFIVAILASSRTFLQTSLGFLAGGLYGGSWEELYSAIPYAAVGLLAAFALAGRLNILVLGDDIAAGLGVLTGRTRLVVLATTGVLTAAAVSVAGLVSFVGLVCPHIARLLLGTDNRYLVPASALVGAILVSSADLIARLVIRPSEIPMGIITAAIGAPFLLWLLRARA